MKRVAKGYPEPKEQGPARLPPLVARGTCVICKRRPAEPERDKCAACIAALSA